MDHRAAAALQKLATLPPDIYARVAEVLVLEFSIPQPSISVSLAAIAPRTALPKPARKKREVKEVASTGPGQPSRSSVIRDMLQHTGPQTTAQIAAAVNIPPNQIHPVLASIGAKPVGVVLDEQGDERKTYGYPSAHPAA